MLIDLKKAHLHAAKCDDEVGVELPGECKKFGKYGKLKRQFFGSREAASGWEDDYASDGFQRGRAASVIFCHPQTHERDVVHGDDFTFAATESELRKMRSFLSVESVTCARLSYWEEA